MILIGLFEEHWFRYYLNTIIGRECP